MRYKIKHTAYCITCALFLKPLYRHNNSTKNSVDVEYGFGTRLLNPLNWILILFVFFIEGLIGAYDCIRNDKEKLGTYYHIKYTFKPGVNWLEKKWINFHEIHGVK